MKKFLVTLFAVVCVAPWMLSGGTYFVSVNVKCDTPEAAQKAQLRFLPLPHGKDVAFSCRWDDSSLAHGALQPLLKKYGYRGTFYLNETGNKAFWQQVFPLLHRDGFTIGNHTRSHKELPRLSANGIHYEIMAWKMLLEYRSDQSVTTFIVPYGKINSEFFPGVPTLIGSLLRRAGIYGGTDFSPDIYRHYGTGKNLHFSGCIVRPGDRNTKMEKFDADVKRHLASGAEHLALGIHSWHSAADLKVLEQCLKKYAFNPRWWYCNENDYIAYKFLYHNAKVVEKSVKGDMVCFQVLLPTPGRLGSDVALDAVCNGRKVSVCHKKALPEKIGIAAGNGRCAKFPGVRAFLRKGTDNSYRLELTNDGSALEDVTLTVVLPPVFKDEQRVISCGKVEKMLSARVYEYTRRDPARESSGRELTAVAVDFVRDGKAGRLWVQHIEDIKHPATAVYPLYYRYAALNKKELTELSCGGGDLSKFIAVQSKMEQRRGMFSLRFEQNWKNVPLVAVVEFNGGKDFVLRGELPPEIIVCGKVFKTVRNQVRFSAPAGKCRLVMNILPGKRMLREIAVILDAVR